MKKLAKISLGIALALISTATFAQEEESEISNVQEFTPSKLLKKGQWDIKVFTSLYTQTKQANDSGDRSDIARSTFFTNTNEIYTGVSNNSRINVGLVFQARANNFNGANALDVFKFENDGTNSRSGITTIAPSVRIQPFENISNFSLTSSFFIPIFKDEAVSGYLDQRSFAWETKFFFDKTFGSGKWQYFTELDFKFNFGEASDEASADENSGERFANNSLGLPASVFLSYFPTSKSTVFVNAQQFFLIDLGNEFNQEFTQIGIGGKYQITKTLNIEASYGKFLRGTSTGLGQSFNIGLRIIL